MKLLQGTVLFLSLCSLCYSQESQVSEKPLMTTVQSTIVVPKSPSPSSEKILESVPTAMITQGKLKTTEATTSPKTSSSLIYSTSTNTEILKELSSTPMIATSSSPSSAVAKTARGAPQNDTSSDVSSTASPQVSTHQLQTTVSIKQSSQQNNETLKFITTPPIKDQGSTRDSGTTSSLLINSSYSSVILPVVIALIAITLSIFILVGLYRMCWKTDPGTPDNGTDQPQSDKESVKLLTVKTISPETSVKMQIATCDKRFP
ncbi:endomucin isoform X3 [Monodelphis domestica]|uniref:endomucin isoform X3 n=1 Tax=Monodelphis domestica TaxID=13616 RepID=UPI0024E271E1|nr:endomucin isoform X3 [Monodelphis domestica]